MQREKANLSRSPSLKSDLRKSVIKTSIDMFNNPEIIELMLEEQAKVERETMLDGLNLLRVLQSLKTSNTDRTLNDLTFIYKFLEKSDIIKNIFKENFFKADAMKFLYLFSFNMTYYKISAGEFLFREGDIANHFYVIIHGRMDILETIKTVEYNDGDEYFKFLISLERSKHQLLLKHTLKLNEDNYPLIQSDLDRFSIEDIYLRKKLNIILKFKPSLLHLKGLLETINPIYEIILGIKFPIEEATNDDSWEQFLSELLTKSKEIQYTQYKYFENTEKRKVTFFSYQHFLTLYPGSHFGDTALDRPDFIRSATLRADEQTELGVIDGKFYQDYVRNEKLKYISKEISFIHSSVFFTQIPINHFKNSYFSMFTLHEYEKNSYIFHQNEKVSSIYFIREGEVELSIDADLNEVEQIILLIKRLIHDKEPKKELDKTISKEKEERRRHKLLIIGNKHCLAIEEFFHSLLHIYNAVVKSDKCKIYKLDIQKLDLILNNFSKNDNLLLKEKTNQFLRAMMNRLGDLKETLLHKIKVKFQENSTENEKTTGTVKRDHSGPALKHLEVINSIDYLDLTKTRNKPKLKPILDSKINITEKLFTIHPENKNNIYKIKSSQDSIDHKAMEETLSITYKKKNSIREMIFKPFKEINNTDKPKKVISSKFKFLRAKSVLPWCFYNQIEPKKTPFKLPFDLNNMLKKSSSLEKIRTKNIASSVEIKISENANRSNNVNDKQLSTTFNRGEEEGKLIENRAPSRKMVINKNRNMSLDSNVNLFKNSSKLNNYIYNSINQNVKRKKN